MLLAMSYYAIYGRKWFKGPKINVDFINVSPSEVLEGQPAEAKSGSSEEPTIEELKS